MRLSLCTLIIEHIHMKPVLRLTVCTASEVTVCVQDFFLFVVEAELPNLQSGKSTPDTRLSSPAGAPR